jgi:hypothetical protein
METAFSLGVAWRVTKGVRWTLAHRQEPASHIASLFQFFPYNAA